MKLFRTFFSASSHFLSGFGLSTVILFGFFFRPDSGHAQSDSLEVKGIKSFAYSRKVKANKEKTWSVISDVSNYHKIASNIDSVEIISGEGKGMVRKCTHKANSWTEVSTLWEEGEQYSFKVNTDAEDYPYPLKFLQGTWKVKEISKNETEIVMRFDFAYSRRIHNWLLHPFMKSKFNKICEELLDNWQRKLENEQ